ncbi:polynucleotide adenylyltransferase PcnB [Paraliomyxa miuraensis]|uniref:polynucleotide adenylyltransferase PcnB n=1 Tax=Paraliomyxa miuraensis TaxID=376150 RepID=UPI00225B81F9|nr:polynucleotide adenylyltransferase PcnB [Paraliomyxa miuraensis]MCX4246920.1 polynucleotide adenylyltransferase PcnB [Paraliomyxa miuraensis]
MSDSKPPTGVEQIFGHIDPDAMKVVRRLLQAGHEAYLVGGCVRDLYLGRTPKDFDVATSATPEIIRKTFRNSRVIGRRFKLAHVFFGPKIIETSTFRTAPPQDDEDPLITHDNEWGTVEDDARRRDFTINGLFYDVEDRRIVDFVDGLDDLDRGVVRTIGDPELRFREDPVRMIRAIKFAARLDFHIDDETWKALLEVAPDIVRSSRARLLEEIYKLLRSGAARRCFELLLEAGLLHRIMPDYTQQFGPDDGIEALQTSLAGESNADDDDADEPTSPDAADLLWRYLDALDDYIRQTQEDVVNGVLQAVLFAPLIADEMAEGTRQQLDRAIEHAMTPVGAAFGVARRDRELARQILMAHRRMTEQRRRRRRSSMAQRQYFHDALIFMGVSVRALGDGGSELRRWKALATLPEESATPAKGERTGRKRSRRRRSGRRPKKGEGDGREAAPPQDG